MPTRDPSLDAASPPTDPPLPPPTGEKSLTTLPQLCVGVKLYVYHTSSSEFRLAEILSITTRAGAPAYYVHYSEFNKRLDEWVTADRLDLSREVEWPRPEKPTKPPSKAEGSGGGGGGAGGGSSGRAQKRPRRADSSAPPAAQKAPKRSRTAPDPDAVDIESEAIGAASPEADEPETPGILGSRGAEAEFQQPAGFSKESEIEKLRTSGS